MARWAVWLRNRGHPERELVREVGNGRLGASRHGLNLDLTPEKRHLLQSQLTPRITCGTRRARALRAAVRVPGEIQASKARDRPYRQVHAHVRRPPRRPVDFAG